MQTRSKKSAARPSKKPVGPDDFKTVARRLGADEDKARFEQTLGMIARSKPKKAITVKRRKK